MNGSKRSLLENIILAILFILSIPFILVGAVLFVIIYIITAPIEMVFYKNSYYYKELKEKYYLTITFNQNYKKYNKIRKQTKYNKEKKFYENKNIVLIKTNNEEDIILSQEKLQKKYQTNKKIYIVVKSQKVPEKKYIIKYED